MTRLILSFFAIAVVMSLATGCNDSSDSISPSTPTAPEGDNQPFETIGKTPLTKGAWCTSDFRVNPPRLTRIQFQDDQKVETSLYLLNPDNTRGPEVPHRKTGSWVQKNDEAITLTFDQKATDLKMRLELVSESGAPRLYMGPSESQMPVFDPCL